MLTRRLLIVRHGLSEWNALGRWQGRADPPLHDDGRAAAVEFAIHLQRDVNVASPMWASTLGRAAETAAVLAAALGVTVDHDDRLVERHIGEWQGLTHTEIREGWPGALETQTFPHDAESSAEMNARLVDGLAHVVTATPPGQQTIVVVSHGGVIWNLIEATGAEATRTGNVAGRFFEVAADGGYTVGDIYDPLGSSTPSFSPSPQER